MTQTAITSLQRSLTEWADKPANEQFLRRDQEALLGPALGDPLRAPQVHVAAWMLGTWHLGHGFVQAMAGNVRGFDEARTGQALRRCALLLRQHHQQPLRRTSGSRLPFSPLHGTLTALLGLALHDPGCEPLYELLRRQPDGAFEATDHLPLFTRELLALRAGERPVVTPRLGPYQDVLMHWHGEPRLLAQALADVLDLHLEQTRGAGATFADPPCQVYPLEVIAVQHVRQWLELGNPKVEHAMMFTNVATMQPTGPWPGHDLVQRLERQLRGR